MSHTWHVKAIRITSNGTCIDKLFPSYLLYAVPSRPVDNVQVSIQAGGVVVTWRGLTRMEANGMPRYIVYYQVIDSRGTVGELMNLTTTDTTATLPSLDEGDSYSIYVAAATGGGNIVGPESSRVIITQMSK